MTVLFFLIVAAGIGVSWEHIKRRLPPSLRSLTTFLPARCCTSRRKTSPRCSQTGINPQKNKTG
jgi:hypothetical protein